MACLMAVSGVASGGKPRLRPATPTRLRRAPAGRPARAQTVAHQCNPVAAARAPFAPERRHKPASGPIRSAAQTREISDGVLCPPHRALIRKSRAPTPDAGKHAGDSRRPGKPRRAIPRCGRK